MTLPAFDSDFVIGTDGPKYRVGPHCANPTCRKWADHAHHIVRRSALSGDYAWVQVEDGLVLGNLTGLCADCHDDITGTIGGHRAAIRYIDGAFMWCKVRDRGSTLEYEPVGLLQPQPPTPESLASTTPRAGETESDSCPTCGHARRRGSGNATPGPRRRRKTWSVKVPDDEEQGAEVLDTMVDDLADSLGYDDPRSALRRYHVLVPALYWAQQNKNQFLREIREAVKR